MTRNKVLRLSMVYGANQMIDSGASYLLGLKQRALMMSLLSRV